MESQNNHPEDKIGEDELPPEIADRFRMPPPKELRCRLADLRETEGTCRQLFATTARFYNHLYTVHRLTRASANNELAAVAKRSSGCFGNTLNLCCGLTGCGAAFGTSVEVLLHEMDVHGGAIHCVEGVVRRLRFYCPKCGSIPYAYPLRDADGYWLDPHDAVLQEKAHFENHGVRCGNCFRGPRYTLANWRAGKHWCKNAPMIYAVFGYKRGRL